MEVECDADGWLWGDTHTPLWDAAAVEGELENLDDLISELLCPDHNPPAATTIPAAAQQQLGSSDALITDNGSEASEGWRNYVDGAREVWLKPDAGHALANADAGHALANADAEQQVCAAAGSGEDWVSKGQKRRRSDHVDGGAGFQDAATETQTTGSGEEPGAATTAESCVDEADAKKQLRLMKNREAASQSRSRKKCYVKELEAKCRMLEVHCTQLQQAINFGAIENLALREELERAKKRKDPACVGAEPAVLERDSLPSESLPRSVCLCLTFLLVCLSLVWKPQPRLRLNAPNGAPARLARKQTDGSCDVVSRVPSACILKKRRRMARRRRVGSFRRKRRLPSSSGKSFQASPGMA